MAAENILFGQTITLGQNHLDVLCIVGEPPLEYSKRV